MDRSHPASSLLSSVSPRSSALSVSAHRQNHPVRLPRVPGSSDFRLSSGFLSGLPDDGPQSASSAHLSGHFITRQRLLCRHRASVSVIVIVFAIFRLRTFVAGIFIAHRQSMLPAAALVGVPQSAVNDAGVLATHVGRRCRIQPPQQSRAAR